MVVNARLAADAVGATKMDRPEWCGVNPANGEIYVALTNNSNRKLEPSGTQFGLDAANPRSYVDQDGPGTSAGNVNGHIIRMAEAAGESAATAFTWDVYLFGAQADALASVNLSGLTHSQDFSSPDGLWFSPCTGVCWIQTDDGSFTNETNCMMLAGLPGRVGHGEKRTLTYTMGDGSTVGLRYFFMRRMPAPANSEIREVYMYSIYERQWHWLQTAAIFGLIFTGLVIHKPEMFGMFSFSGVVFVHNGVALILVVNAALSAFYHLVSGEIRQFLPRPYGFFERMFVQTKYYLYGIFRGEAHPYEKTREQKMNPIQQMTYFGLLNVLLPLQVITGALMWGAQAWPEWKAALGGLPLLAPFHSLIAWLLSTFIVLHVYMTTTGHEPMSNIKAMIFGWDEVESHSHNAPETGD